MHKNFIFIVLILQHTCGIDDKEVSSLIFNFITLIFNLIFSQVLLLLLWKFCCDVVSHFPKKCVFDQVAITPIMYIPLGN